MRGKGYAKKYNWTCAFSSFTIDKKIWIGAFLWRVSKKHKICFVLIYSYLQFNQA